MRLEEVMPRIRENLAKGKNVQLAPMGDSMLPMLKGGRDSILLSPLPPHLRKYDVALYQRADGSYVLHRIVGEKNGSYICCGDNQRKAESGIPHSKMIAVMTAFIRNGKFHSADEWGYRLYSRFIHDFRRLQGLFRRLRSKTSTPPSRP